MTYWPVLAALIACLLWEWILLMIKGRAHLYENVLLTFILLLLAVGWPVFLLPFLVLFTLLMRRVWSS